MAQDSLPEERTEEPTEKKWQQVREEGTLPVSNDLNQIAVLLLGFIMLTFVAGSLWDATKKVMIFCFKRIAEKEQFTFRFLTNIIEEILWWYIPPLSLLFVFIALVAMASTFLQTKFNIKKKKIDFKFNTLNPVTGLGKIFSPKGFVQLLKAVLKLGLIMPVGAYSLYLIGPKTVSLVGLKVPQILDFFAESVQDIFWSLVYVLVPLAIGDYVYSRYTFFRENRMTKQEVKEERKNLEGDEATKRKIKSKGLERGYQRIMEAVPQADVVVTNPTHYAVALKYDRSSGNAPIVLAKGKNHLALRIREIARENRVPLVRRRMLARALYASVRVGAQIPSELFTAVAEVLAYVYRIKGKNIR